MDLEAKEARIARDGDKARKGAVAAMWLLFFVVAVVWLGKRDHEWDLLAYVGCVYELGEAEPETLHGEVYQAIDAGVPAEEAQALRAKNEYRSLLSDDPAAFVAQLPFYRGRVLYIGAIAVLHAAGMSPIDGAFLVSWLAGVALLVALGLWMRARGGGSHGIILGNLLVLAAIGFFFKTPTTATPDALAAALVLWGAYLLLETRRLTLGLTLLGLSLAARADHIVLVAPLVAWCALGTSAGARVSPRALVLSATAYLVVLLACTAGRGTYAPWVVFQHTFVEYMAFPLQETPPFDLTTWVRRVAISLPQFKAVAPLLFTSASLLALALGWRRDKWRDPGTGLAAVALLATLVHFALFPALWPRLMFPYWVLGVMALGRGASGTSQPRSAHSSP